MLLQKYIKIWHLNKEKECWMNPPFGNWKLNKYSKKVNLIDDNNIIKEKQFFLKNKWADLLRETDYNLKKEDRDKNIIVAFYKGYLARKNIEYKNIIDDYIIC